MGGAFKSERNREREMQTQRPGMRLNAAAMLMKAWGSIQMAGSRAL